MKDITEEILEEVGEKFATNRLLRVDADNKLAREIVSKAIDQTREETKKEIFSKVF